MEGFWAFLELAARKWAWECRHADGTTTRRGPFFSLAECLQDAKDKGFMESKRDRRKIPRPPPAQGTK
ncbi:MAG TPA: hypothetical protein VN496_03380 [Burkholderiales bacterium]|nr:hypothetical protein [Burkholderiales bacterium]